MNLKSNALAVAGLTVVASACGTSGTNDLGATEPGATLPPIPVTVEMRVDPATPLHPLNELLIGAPTINHLELRAAPFVEKCMSDAGFDLTWALPPELPATYGERSAAAETGSVPTPPFFIADAAAEQYVALGDVDQDRQAAFAAALEGTDTALGCAELGRLAARSSEVLDSAARTEFGGRILQQLEGPRMQEAEQSYVRCLSSLQIEVTDSGDLTDKLNAATYRADQETARQLFAAHDQCAAKTIDIAEIEVTKQLLDELASAGIHAAADLQEDVRLLPE